MENIVRKTKSLSIVIPTKDRPDFIKRCITSLIDQSIMPDELIVVDASLSRETEKVILNITNLLPYLCLYIKSQPSVNFQRNLGISKATSELITLIDDDVVLHKDYLLHVKEFYSRDTCSNIGALSTKILDSESSFKKSIFSVSELIGIFFLLGHSGSGKFQKSGIPSIISSNINEVKKVEFIFGGNATYPKHVLNEFKFDESLPYGYVADDDDIAYRISRKYQNYYTPNAILYHKSHYLGNNRYEKSKSFVINYWYLIKKNYNKTMSNTLAFSWAVLGKLILETYFSIKLRNFSSFHGVISGIFRLLKN